MDPLVDAEGIAKATKNARPAQLRKEQRLDVRFHIEHPATTDRPRKFLEAFAAILRHNPSYGLALDHYIRVQAKCGRCSTQCMLYQATGDPKDVPCERSGMILDIYRRYFTLGGRIWGGLTGQGDLTDETLQEMAESVWNCTACRKCTLECPSGIDHGLLTHLSRYILSEIDIAPRALVVSTREQLEGKTGNTSGFPLPAIIDGLEFLEDDMEEEQGVKMKFPLDVEGADYVFFPAVSDFMMEAETLMGNAAVFAATGDSWTIGKQCHDGINYGLFYSDRVWDRVVSKVDAETRRLKGKAIMIGECGHASRSAKFGIPMFCGGKDALPVINCMEYAYESWKNGKLKLIPGSIEERVTYHDPCNISRVKWIIEQPRELLKYICKDYVEMTPNREENICCGGGGGTVSIDEVRPYRTGVAGKAKAEQIRATGAKYCVAPCANCKKQLKELMEDQKVDCEIVGLHDLLYKAIDYSVIKERQGISDQAPEPDAEAAASEAAST
ncbi:MAG: (Fe-S)-binding protein [Phycisphaerae bacterium]|nr:(Fe-S)-binding protein [Phycisphaerae bacterium]